jgi:hypothetical protein
MALPFEPLEPDPIRLDCGVTHLPLVISHIDLEAPPEPFDAAVAIECEDMSSEAIEEEAVMGVEYGAAEAIFQCRF